MQKRKRVRYLWKWRIKNKLIEKLEREINEFKDTLRGLSADEIMDNSYKLTCITEIKDYLIYDKDYSRFELKTLLKIQIYWKNVMMIGYLVMVI